MYKLKLIGPNAGKTIRIRDYQFVDGYCLVNTVPQNLIKYYGVVVEEDDLQEESEEVIVQESDESINNEQEESVDEGQDILSQVVAAKKAELEKKVEEPKYKTQADFSNWFQYKAYVKEVSGKNPKNGKQAEEIMAGLS